jgi:hypothetical protein
MSSATTQNDPSADRDYQNPSTLKSAFEREGTIIGTANYFGIAPATCRKWLLRYDLYEPESEGLENPAQQLSELDPEDVGLKAIGER